jgi:hypothetical protein
MGPVNQLAYILSSNHDIKNAKIISKVALQQLKQHKM